MSVLERWRLYEFWYLHVGLREQSVMVSCLYYKVSIGPWELSVIEGCPFHIGGHCMKFCIFIGLRELSVIVSYPCCWGGDCMKFGIFGTMRTATQEIWDIIFTSMDWNLNNVDFREIHVFSPSPISNLWALDYPHAGAFTGARISSLVTNACLTENDIPFPGLANHTLYLPNQG